MSYVLHVYRMTYKTYDIQKCIFVQDTEHHADIINLVNSNARLIEQRMVATT